MLSKQDIEKYLEELNDKLRAKGTYGEIVIAGGAALSLVFNAR